KNIRFIFEGITLTEDMWKNVLLVFLGACSFGILSTFVKIAYSEGYTVGEVTGVQVFFGMSTLWIIYGTGIALGLFSKKKVEKDPFWKLILSGLSTGSVRSEEHTSELQSREN